MNEAAALIQLQNVSKVFYTDEIETHALDGVDLSIYPGEYVAISGPSGCGKSTLLSILGLLDSPYGGRLHAERSSRYRSSVRPPARGPATGRSASSSRASI